MDLLVEIYRLTGRLPSSERFGLSAQLRRAAVSIPSNIAEGYCRDHRGDYLRFLSIAKGSVGEIDTQMVAISRLELLTEAELQSAVCLCDEVGRMLRRMVQTLSRRP